MLASKQLGLPFILRELGQIRVHLEALALMNPEAPVIPPHHVFVMVLFASVQIAFLWVDPHVRSSPFCPSFRLALAHHPLDAS